MSDKTEQEFESFSYDERPREIGADDEVTEETSDVKSRATSRPFLNEGAFRPTNVKKLQAAETIGDLPYREAKMQGLAGWIKALLRRFKRERKIRAEIAYYSRLPDWALNDIGMERGQIEFAVRSETPAHCK